MPIARLYRPKYDHKNLSQVQFQAFSAAVQNTMLMGWGGWPAGEKMILGVRGKNEKGEIKKEENYIKTGEKA